MKSLRDELEVKAPHGGIVVEWLVEEGDPVAPGQPLVRLHPNGGNCMTDDHRLDRRDVRRRCSVSGRTGRAASYRTRRSWSRSTPVTSGSRPGPGSRNGAGPSDDETVLMMSVNAAKDALADVRHRPGPDRLRHRRHRHAPLPDPGDRDPGRRRGRRPDRGRVRHLRRLRGLLLRHRDGQRHGPRRQREVRAGDRGRATQRHHRPDRPRYGVHLRRRRGCRRGRAVRRAGDRPGRLGFRRHPAPGDQPEGVLAGGGRQLPVAAPARWTATRCSAGRRSRWRRPRSRRSTWPA